MRNLNRSLAFNFETSTASAAAMTVTFEAFGETENSVLVLLDFGVVVGVDARLLLFEELCFGDKEGLLLRGLMLPLFNLGDETVITVV